MDKQTLCDRLRLGIERVKVIKLIALSDSHGFRHLGIRITSKIIVTIVVNSTKIILFRMCSPGRLSWQTLDSRLE